jgi:hypothetical protein
VSLLVAIIQGSRQLSDKAHQLRGVQFVRDCLAEFPPIPRSILIDAILIDAILIHESSSVEIELETDPEGLTAVKSPDQIPDIGTT